MTSVIVGSLGVGVFGWLSPKIKQSSFFQFKEIIALKTEHISENELKNLVDIPNGINIFDIDLHRLEIDVEKHPWVLRAHISRILPRHIRIQVDEKNPVAILSQDELFYLDKDGAKIASLRAGESTRFPILSGISNRQVEEKKIIQQAYGLIEQYEMDDVLKKYPLSELHWNDVQGFIFYPSDPTFEIRVGKDDYPKRFKRLKKVLNDLAQKSVIPKVIDLNFNKKVVVKVQK